MRIMCFADLKHLQTRARKEMSQTCLWRKFFSNLPYPSAGAGQLVALAFCLHVGDRSLTFDGRG